MNPRLLAIGLLVLSGCGGSGPAPAARPALLRIEAGEGAAKAIQTAFIKAEPGDVVELGAGRFEFVSTLSLDVDAVAIRGQGMGKTTLSFAKQGQGTGGEGLLVTAKNGFRLERLTIEDAKGDGVKVNGTDGVVLREVEATWSAGPKETNGGYGLYPVLCRNVLVEKCRVSGASDAGIYIGQSENVIVRENLVEANVAGIEIENCIRSDVHGNVATGNSGGVLVFALPDLPKKECRDTRVFKNKVIGNNHVNFAPKGNIVATVPAGTGMLVMAADSVEIFDNDVEENDAGGVTVISYESVKKAVKDEKYDPKCSAVSIHDNRFARNGREPHAATSLGLSILLGRPLPDVISDGRHVASGGVFGLSVRDNPGARFGEFDFPSFGGTELLQGKSPRVLKDASIYGAPIAPLPSVTLEVEP